MSDYFQAGIQTRLDSDIIYNQNKSRKSASIKERFSASIIDMGVLFVLFVPIYFVDYFTNNAINQGQIIGSLTTLYLFVWLFVFTFYDSYAISTYGCTVGQKLTHIKVKMDNSNNSNNDNSPISFERIMFRKMIGAFVIPVLWEFIDPDNQGLHGKLTHTCMIGDDENEYYVKKEESFKFDQ